MNIFIFICQNLFDTYYLKQKFTNIFIKKYLNNENCKN
jgi:hypothetical protein